METKDKITILTMLSVLLTVKSTSDLKKAQKLFLELNKKGKLAPWQFVKGALLMEAMPETKVRQYEGVLHKRRIK